jgi:hypothetical protein
MKCAFFLGFQIFDISVDNDNNEQLKVNNVLLYGKEIQASPIRAPQVEAGVSLADVRSAVEKVTAAGASAAFPYQVVGLGFESYVRDAADVVTISIKVQSLEKQKVHGLPTMHARVLKTADGKLKIDRVDLEAAPAAAAAEEDASDKSTTTSTTGCTTLPVLCKWRALLLSRFRRVKTAVHHCIRCLCHRLRMGGLFKIRLHGFQIHPHNGHHHHHHSHHNHEQQQQQHKMVEDKQQHEQGKHAHASDPTWHNGVNTHNPFGPGSRPEPGSPAAKLLEFFGAYPKKAPSAAATATTTTTAADAADASAAAIAAAAGLGDEDDKHLAAAAAAGLFGLSYASFVIVYASLAASLVSLLAAVGYVSLRQYCRMRAARRSRGAVTTTTSGGSGGYVALPGPVFLEESGPFGLAAKFAPATPPLALAADVEAKPFLPAYVEDDDDDDDDEKSAAGYRDEKTG